MALKPSLKPPPKGWPRISQSLFYKDANAAIDWLCRVFGFEVRLKVVGEGGKIEYSELTFHGEGLISVGEDGHGDRPEHGLMRSPRSLDGANTVAIGVVVDDVDAHAAHAKAQGAEIFREVATTDYGDDYWADRTYGAKDCDGHLWFFMQRIRDQ